jgi:FKBP-type peptidyl-prolyl cis-trans isomerase FklB
MKNIALVLLTLIGVIIMQDVSAQRSKKQKLENQIDSVSYAIGVSFASSVKSQNITDLNLEKIYLAINDILKNDQAKMTAKESQSIIQSYMLFLQEEIKNNNLIKANVFLEDNKSKEGIITLPSGLQYQVLKEGEGQSPAAFNRVITHYKGSLLDGTEFDNSYERGKPITFGVTRVIKAWQEALQLMKPGAKWKLFVHPDLAYGEQGKGQIPANALLIFEIELIGIE